MIIEPADGVGALGKSEIEIAQQIYPVGTYELRHHPMWLVHHKIAVLYCFIWLLQI